MDGKEFRTQPPESGDERAMLEGFLDFHRGTMLWKVSGLTGEQLATASIEPSALTLLGLIRHAALNERWWFRRRAMQEDVEEVYDLSDNPDAELLELDPARYEEDLAIFQAEIEAARAAVKDVPLDHTFDFDGSPMTLRWVFLHMIEEYARHNGHADLLRERIDGATGE